jgi:hypothetical protein
VGDGLVVVQAGAAAELLAGFVEDVNKNVMLFVDLGHAGDQAVVPDEGAGFSMVAAPAGLSGAERR